VTVVERLGVPPYAVELHRTVVVAVQAEVRAAQVVDIGQVEPVPPLGSSLSHCTNSGSPLLPLYTDHPK